MKKNKYQKPNSATVSTQESSPCHTTLVMYNASKNESWKETHTSTRCSQPLLWAITPKQINRQIRRKHECVQKASVREYFLVCKQLVWPHPYGLQKDTLYSRLVQSSLQAGLSYCPCSELENWCSYLIRTLRGNLYSLWMFILLSSSNIPLPRENNVGKTPTQIAQNKTGLTIKLRIYH